MQLKQIVEFFTQTEDSNQVINTVNHFVQGSVVVTKKATGAVVSFKEMGSNIIRLKESVGKEEVLEIKYNITVTTVNTELDLLKEIRDLKARCDLLEEMQVYLLEGLKEKVPQATFKQWIMLMEKSFGKPILDNKYLMGLQSESLPWENKP